MRGHEEASGTKYVPKELMDLWAAKDPVKNFEVFLLDEGVINQAFIDAYKSEIKAEIEDGLNLADAEEVVVADTPVMSSTGSDVILTEPTVVVADKPERPITSDGAKEPTALVADNPERPTE